MALVVLLKGVNVGGHRTFRPARFVEELRHLGAVNIGATGLFVIRRRIRRDRLRAEIAQRLPFDAEIVICDARKLIGQLKHPAFANYRLGPDDVRFVTVLSRPVEAPAPLPLSIPASGKWFVKLIACDGQFVLGIYRRQMRVIGYLGALDRIFGVAATTRSWTTIEAVAKLLDVRTT